VGEPTPGPWTMTEQGSPSAYVEDSETSIGIVSPTGRVAAVEGWDNALDNARLIAAAPDLLAALEGLLSEAEGMDSQIHGEWGTGVWPGGDDVKEIVDARAAIAKAKGEA
jgi:hypothetical protein